jgi:hypothetical protein
VTPTLGRVHFEARTLTAHCQICGLTMGLDSVAPLLPQIRALLAEHEHGRYEPTPPCD